MPAVQSSTCIIYNKFAYMWIEIFTTDGDLRNLSSVATEVELKITVFFCFIVQRENCIKFPISKLWKQYFIKIIITFYYLFYTSFLVLTIYYFLYIYFHFIGRSNDLLNIYSLNIAFYIYIIKIIFIIIFEKVVPQWHTFFNSSIVVFHALYQCFS